MGIRLFGLNQYILIMLLIWVRRVGDTNVFNTYGYKMGRYRYFNEERINDISSEMIFDMRMKQYFKFRILL